MNAFVNPVRSCDVAVIGGGPAGLAAATRLKGLGVRDVLVLEREAEAGGIPRHCGHSPFGMREFARVFSGPRYARKLVERAMLAGAEIWTGASVRKIEAKGRILVVCDRGPVQVVANRVIYATGVREESRAARLVSGQRPSGVLNTGALQSMIHEYRMRPFERPVIVGSELIAFSALLTCFGAGMRPVGMLEENSRITARFPAAFLPALRGVPLHLETRLHGILGDRQVRGVRVAGPRGVQRDIPCDGVVLTGRFRPESSLCQASHLLWDERTLGPVVDQFGRCSDPVYFAAGNVLRPVETAGWSWSEGKRIGEMVALDLSDRLPPFRRFVEVCVEKGPLHYVMPQRFNVAGPAAPEALKFQLRVNRPVRGTLFVRTGGQETDLGRISGRPQRRIIASAEKLKGLDISGPLVFGLRPV